MKKHLVLAMLMTTCIGADAAIRLEGAFRINGKELQNSLTLDDQQAFRFWTSSLAFTGQVLEQTNDGVKVNVVIGIVPTSTDPKTMGPNLRIDPVITNATLQAAWNKDAFLSVHKTDKLDVSVRLKFSRTT